LPPADLGKRQTSVDLPSPTIEVLRLLADCALRAVRLLDTPKAIPMLYPAIMREICYWLLTGPHGGEVAKMMLANSHAQRVIRAIHTLRDRFAGPVRVDELALIAQSFRVPPPVQGADLHDALQYQKRLRLLEARRLMVSSAANVETAAFEVGYESPSQFSREYSRMFRQQFRPATNPQPTFLCRVRRRGDFAACHDRFDWRTRR
jgi:AraC-like DNA-binding protein